MSACSVPLVLSHVVHLLLRVAAWIVTPPHFLHLAFSEHFTDTFGHGLPLLLEVLLLLLVCRHLVAAGGTDVGAHPWLLLACGHVALRHLLGAVLLRHVAVVAGRGARRDRGLVVRQAVLGVAALTLGPQQLLLSLSLVVAVVAAARMRLRRLALLRLASSVRPVHVLVLLEVLTLRCVGSWMQIRDAHWLHVISGILLLLRHSLGLRTALRLQSSS